MLNINAKSDSAKLELELDGRLEANTAPDLERKLKESLDGVNELVMNLERLEYISSAGLRVLISAQKIMNKKGTMLIINASDKVKEIFDVTGLSEILNTA